MLVADAHQQAGDGIYLMEIFTPEFCQQLVREVEHFEARCAREKIDILRPNSMNHYGVRSVVNHHITKTN